MYTISDLKHAVEKLNVFTLSLDQIRKLELTGIVVSTQKAKGKYRYFTDEQFEKSLKNILFYYFNTPIEEIKTNGEALKLRAKKILKAVRRLTK